MGNNSLLNNEGVPPGAADGMPQGSPERKKGKGGTGAARQTLYRVTVRNQLRSISIADQKANILIGINTILISVIIAGLGAGSSMAGLRFISELDLSIPFTFFLIACFVSTWLAILAVRPMMKPWRSDAKRTVFFKDFKNIELEDFQEFVGDVLKSGENVYESLNTDMWLFGQTLVKKFSLLRLAYVVFMIGLAGLVIMFLAFNIFI